jgi:hypothetical protein
MRSIGRAPPFFSASSAPACRQAGLCGESAAPDFAARAILGPHFPPLSSASNPLRSFLRTHAHPKFPPASARRYTKFNEVQPVSQSKYGPIPGTFFDALEALMFKWIILGILAVVLAGGSAAYVVLSAAPHSPGGACPAVFADTPYDSNAIVYFDAAAMRDNAFAQKFNSLEKSAVAAPAYADFVEKTGLNPDRDIDHVLLSFNFVDSTGSAVLEGRFDAPKIGAYIEPLGKKKHYESGDIYTFQAGSIGNTVGLAFLDPTHVAISAGTGSETQLLVIADAVKNPTPGLRDDMCALAERVSGAPVFAVGNIPEKLQQQIALLAARSTEPAAKTLVHVTGWDFAGWAEGDALRFSAEAQFDSRYDAFQALLSFKDGARRAHDELAKSHPAPKGRNPMDDLSTQLASQLVNNFAFSLDGRYVRVGTSLKKSDIEKLIAQTPNMLSH